MTNVITAEGQKELSGVDSGGYHNIVTVKYTVGWYGSSADYVFSNDADSDEEGLQLGGTNIIPALARVIDVVVVATEGWTGGGGAETAFATVVGTASGGAQYMTSVNIDGLNDIGGCNVIKSGMPPPSASATSVYISKNPTINNWGALTAGIDTVYITYIDNSAL